MSPSIHQYRPQRTALEDLEAILVGRQPLLQEILGRLSRWQPGNSRQHYLVIGPRGIGKTYLLRLIDHRACSKPGTLVAFQEVAFTAAAYGPVMVICCWAKGYQDPMYLVSNMRAAEKACRFYQKRFRIETFFSDQKSRGFHLHKSHMSRPERLSRLLIASCLASI